MSGSATTLPEFKKPPVIEVAVSIQFKELAKISAPHLGMLWAEHYRERYPQAQQQPPLTNVREAFSPTPARATVEVLPNMPVPRCWFLSEEGTRLIQVQADRFVLNWRKLDTGESYPRYKMIKKQFTEEFARFEKWLQTEGLGEIEIDQSELTYVNHVFEGDGWSTGDNIGNVLTLWSGRVHDDYLHDPEDVRFATRYVMPVAEKPTGRLHVRAQIASRISDDRRLIKLSLIGRGPPIGEAIEGAMTMMDQAHEWIVRGFAAITSAEMHQRWERIQ